MSPPLKRILCIDDERDILDVTQMCLERIGGYEVFCCEGGQDAVAQAEATMPDLIMLDVMMPGQTGPDVFAALRKVSRLKGIPVIFMTARVQSAEIKTYLKQGVTSVIAKPFDAMTLAADVQNAWESFHAAKS
ncbi:hypothetical protein AEAC466_08745 [Asticcacaulis sp. AC466]|uniref:response regulator n=1 Tax=Asticcacaulis sp. AC466 TaxID=1282362 RepID=UPI0003C3D550|nr:response regulator [Asticcacaulis sp. AC466]ESQ84431.1 hypothetical protein AEAC466_08745 [Asticcacaulis sp. AC466]